MDAGDGLHLTDIPAEDLATPAPSPRFPGLAIKSAIFAVPAALIGTIYAMSHSDLGMIWAVPVYAALGLLVMAVTMALSLLWYWFGL